MNTLTGDIIVNEFGSKLYHLEFLRLTATSKALRLDPRVQEKIRQIKEAQFAKVYGAVAYCESHLEVEDLEVRTEKLPKLLPYIKLRDEDDKYLYYKGDYHTKYHAEVKALFKSYSDVLNEFLKAPLSESHPLQDMRNKYRRLQVLKSELDTLVKEVESTKDDYNKFLKTFDLFEKILFPGYSYLFDTVIDPSEATKKLIYELEVFSHKLTPSTFLAAKIYHLGEGIFQLKEQQIPFTITASPLMSGSEFTGKTYVSIDRKDDQKRLGDIQFKRQWKESDNSGCYWGDSNKVQRSIITEKSRLLFQVNDYTRRESSGDYPMLKILTQIAVEIFKREAETTLIFDWTSYANSFVIFAGGFQVADIRTVKIIKELFDQARNQNIMFPDPIIYYNYTHELNKVKTEKTEFGHEFYNRNTNTIIILPASVDFEMDTPPITWEEKIAQNPYITAPDGPILPKFYTYHPQFKG